MKKILLVSSFVALLASSSFAEGFFIGGEGGFGSTSRRDKINYQDEVLNSASTYETIDANQNLKDSLLNLIYGLNIGYIITENHRVYVAYGSLLSLSSSNVGITYNMF